MGLDLKLTISSFCVQLSGLFLCFQALPHNSYPGCPKELYDNLWVVRAKHSTFWCKAVSAVDPFLGVPCRQTHIWPAFISGVAEPTRWISAWKIICFGPIN